MRTLRVSLFAIALALLALVPTPDLVYGFDYVEAFDEGPPGWNLSDLSVAAVENVAINTDGFWRSGATDTSNAILDLEMRTEIVEGISIRTSSTNAAPDVIDFDDTSPDHAFNDEPDFVKRE